MRYVFLLLFVNFSITQSYAQLRYEDQIRIREAQRISYQFGDLIWDRYNEPPFAILFVMDDYEYLIEHYHQSDNFDRIGYDTMIHSALHRRATQMNKHFLATFPFEGLHTIVIGTPENTGLNSTEWIITLLHERFHQYQYSAPSYLIDLNEMGLDRGDKSGMWQLNYPFPYKDPDVIAAYESYTQKLYEAVMALGQDDWQMKLSAFKTARKTFEETLSPNDYKYISFQWYQEGIARYTEYAFLEFLDDYKPSAEVEGLTDYVPFSDYKKAFFERHIENIINLKLEKVGRLTVYDVGFAEALLLREIDPDWNKKYLKSRFDLGRLY